jgi:hypothetical protein
LNAIIRGIVMDKHWKSEERKDFFDAHVQVEELILF